MLNAAVAARLQSVCGIMDHPVHNKFCFVDNILFYNIALVPVFLFRSEKELFFIFFLARDRLALFFLSALVSDQKPVFVVGSETLASKLLLTSIGCQCIFRCLALDPGLECWQLRTLIQPVLAFKLVTRNKKNIFVPI